MSAVVAAPRARWINAAWLALVAGWICLLVPGMRAAQLIGLALIVVALLLSVVAIVRGGVRAGLLPLLAALVVSPLIYFGGGMLQARRAGTSPSMTSTGSAVSNVAGDTSTTHRPAPVVTAPPAPRPDIAMRTTVTAVELSGAYDGGAAAADKQFKGQRLLLVGMVDSIDPDAAGGPRVTFNAGDLAPVLARGLSRDVAASLRVGQQVILACDGAGSDGGKAAVDGCKLTH